MNAAEQQADVFLYRLLGFIGTALGVLLVVCSAYLALDYIPTREAFLQDFGAQTPALTSLILRVPWAPMAISWLGVCLGVLAIITARKVPLGLCWAVVLLSMAIVLLARYAVELPMQTVLESIGGV
ncbi:MAG: hypothetical protein JXB13_21760 [Phycisphaerae bacterium]|nr:hypothetical protein [Phycisphaerae bacterium]